MRTRGPRTVGGPVVRVLPVIKAMFSPEAMEENEDEDEMISSLERRETNGLFFVIIIVYALRGCCCFIEQRCNYLRTTALLTEAIKHQHPACEHFFLLFARE